MVSDDKITGLEYAHFVEDGLELNFLRREFKLAVAVLLPFSFLRHEQRGT